MDAEAWNERYRSAQVWSVEPNEALVAHIQPVAVAGLAGSDPARRPTALDLGCGEGADARWLAANGWSVVGVDWAGVAVERATSIAEAAGLAAHFVEGDVTNAALLAGLSETGDFDLVLAGYLHPEPADRARVFAQLPPLVAPGGQLLVIAHDPAHGELGLPGPPQPRLLASAEIESLLDLPEDYAVAISETRTRKREGRVTAVDSVVLVSRSRTAP